MHGKVHTSHITKMTVMLIHTKKVDNMLRKTDEVDCPCMDNVTFNDCCDCIEYWNCYDENGEPKKS